MKIKLISLLLLFAMVGAVLAQEVPTENPSEVWVKGRKLDHGWKDGRIVVNTQDLYPLLGIKSDLPRIDLLSALDEKGGYVWTVEGGKFEAVRDRSLYREADSSVARRQNRTAARNAQYRKPSKSKSKDIGLKYQVIEVDTDWGYRWGAVKVTNTLDTPSDVCTAYCHFQDGFGRTYAEDWWPIRSLQPGESMVFEISSGTRSEDTSITPTSDNVAVYFFSNEDVTKNPKSMNEARARARKNKTRNSNSTLDFNRHTRGKTIPGSGIVLGE